LVPSFAAKLIGQLSEIRRSNGDVFLTTCLQFKDHESFLEYCKTVESFLLEMDLIHIFPTIGSRFKDNSIPRDKIRSFFSKIYESSDICDVISIFINELNWISKAGSRDIISIPAYRIYEFVFVINQDSRIYGFRSYRTSGDQHLIYNNEINFHNIHALISILFIDSIHTYIDGEYYEVQGFGMFDSVINFDINFNQVCAPYLSAIFKFYNSSGPTGSGDKSSNNRSTIKDKTSWDKNPNSSLLSNGSAAFPKGKRSYSSNSRGNESNMDFSAKLLINGNIVNFNFSSSKAMVKFINDYFNKS
jgi:hypothetical protein